MNTCQYQKTIPCQPPQHLIAIHCTRCQHQATHLLCQKHWDLYQWTLAEHVGANCPVCWNPVQAARTDITGQEEISYYGEK